MSSGLPALLSPSEEEIQFLRPRPPDGATLGPLTGVLTWLGVPVAVEVASDLG